MGGCQESLEMFTFWVSMCLAENQSLYNAQEGKTNVGNKCQFLGHSHVPFLPFVPQRLVIVS